MDLRLGNIDEEWVGELYRASKRLLAEALDRIQNKRRLFDDGFFFGKNFLSGFGEK